MSLQLAGDFRRFRSTQVIFDPSAISFLMCIFLQNELIKRHQQAKNASEFACVKRHTHGKPSRSSTNCIGYCTQVTSLMSIDNELVRFTGQHSLASTHRYISHIQ